MKLCIDSNNILCASETIEQGKVYSHTLQWHTVSSHDTTVFVEHKKKIKTIQFKDIGSSMAVFYVANRKTALWQEPLRLDTAGAINALMLYKSYDEQANKEYAFLYKYPSNNSNILNTQLQLIGLDAQIQKTDKGLIVSANPSQQAVTDTTTDIQTIMSYLFVLTLLYGKMDIKNNSLMSIKIHIHLFGAYLKEQQIFDTLLYFLQSKGIFFQKSIIQNNDGVTYQISSQDYEVLAGFAQLYKSIAKIDKIPTIDKMSQAKSTLLSHIQLLQETGELQADSDVLTALEQQVVKVITK